MRAFLMPCAAVLGLAAVAPARADLVFSLTPDATYQAQTTNIPITAPDFSTNSTLSDSRLTVTFSQGLEARTVPDSWSFWSDPPNSESSTPRVLSTGPGVASLTLNFNAPLRTFGVEMEPNAFNTFDMTETFLNGTQVVGVLDQEVSGAGGALLFAGTSDTPFTSVVLAADPGADGFGIAEVRYSLAAVPEPSSLLLAATGAALTAAALAWHARRPGAGNVR